MNHALYQHMEMLRQQAVVDAATSDSDDRLHPPMHLTLCVDQARPLPQAESMTVKALQQQALLLDRLRRRDTNDRWASTPSSSGSGNHKSNTAYCCQSLPAPPRVRPRNSLEDSAEWDARQQRRTGDGSTSSHSTTMTLGSDSSLMMNPNHQDASHQRFLSHPPPSFKANAPPRDALTTAFRHNSHTAPLVRPQRRPSTDFSPANADEILSTVLLALEVEDDSSSSSSSEEENDDEEED